MRGVDGCSGGKPCIGAYYKYLILFIFLMPPRRAAGETNETKSAPPGNFAEALAA
jgi:hypothetical protein